MRKELNFIKLVGSGNDFVLVDALRLQPRINYKKLSPAICHRYFGAGADGLLVAEASKKMRIFNPDGSEADMCGNGARCFAYYLSRKLRQESFSFKTNAGILQARVKDNLVKISMAEPKDLRLNLDIALTGKKLTGHYINTGVPHVVTFVDDPARVDVKELGRQIREHALFKPKGTNVNFVKVLSKDTLKIRTYERGVEDETLACGTGSTAAAIIAALTNKVKPVRGSEYCVKAATQGGEVLKIYFNKNDSLISDVWLEGKVRQVYKGTYYKL